jgi:hypothetical protein
MHKKKKKCENKQMKVYNGQEIKNIISTDSLEIN